MQFPAVYQILANRVRPVRERNNRKIYRDRWWIYAEPRSELRRASAGISRYIATCRTAKFRIFNFEDVATLPDAKIVAVTLEDAFFAGVLTSKIHQVFAFRIGGWLGVGNDSNYNHSDCFGKFPFPADVSEPLKDRICGEAEALNALRKCVLAAHHDLTLTGLYNVLELLRENGSTPTRISIPGRKMPTSASNAPDTEPPATAPRYAEMANSGPGSACAAP